MDSLTISVVGDVSPPSAHMFRGDSSQPVDQQLQQALKADIVIANLECVVLSPGGGWKAKTTGLPLPADQRLLSLIKKFGITCVSLANNHNLDFGSEELEKAIDMVEEEGIVTFGAGTRSIQAGNPVFFKCQGQEVALIGLGGTRRPGRTSLGSYAFDRRVASRILQRARERSRHILVYLHDGIEGYPYPRRRIQEFARFLIDGGTSAVFCTHAHVVQGIEYYRSAPIVYGLGNFTTQMAEEPHYSTWLAQTPLTLMGREIRKQAVREGMVVRLLFNTSTAPALEFAKVNIDDLGMPFLASQEEQKTFASYISEISIPLHDSRHHLWEEAEEIDRQMQNIQRQRMDWGSILSHVYRVRPRHIAWLLRSFKG